MMLVGSCYELPKYTEGYSQSIDQNLPKCLYKLVPNFPTIEFSEKDH